MNVDIDCGKTTAKLLFVMDPDIGLAQVALKLFCNQVKKLSSMPKDKMSVLESEHKLQVLGFVEFVFNLSYSAKDLIMNVM